MQHDNMESLIDSLHSLETEDGLEYLGFKGFFAIAQLRLFPDEDFPAPTEQGVYLVIRRRKARPEFRKPGTDGYFKDEDPNAGIKDLRTKWVENALILYIGKSDNLQRRIKELINFGNGKNAAHDGGRLLSQLEDAEYLDVGWKTAQNAKQQEAAMLKKFKEVRQGKLPFANLKG